MTGRPRHVLITGTDTGVGKTFVACRLAEALRGAGRRVIAIKPVESGCGAEIGDVEDGVLLARATGQSEPLTALVRLARPVAPPVAADAEGVALDHEEWCREIRSRAHGADVVLVEGAGGLLSPLTWSATGIDLARDLRAEALVVAPDRLGTINHTRLTLMALRSAGIPVLGVVFSAPGPADASTGTNAAALARAEPGTAISKRVRDVAEWLEG
jgi:dethiobiotin synthetase